MKTSKILAIIIFSLAFPVLLKDFFVFVISAQTSSDAIAIRILPNPGHMSALDWYKERNFTGSPQSVKVDGYSAVRDGRTVYVNVVNVNGNDLHTNIYLISYNQDAEKATSDVFSNILKHWRFNANINTFGRCRGTGANCIYDNECRKGDFCDSLKARVIRDARRLENLHKAGVYLRSYYEKNSQYPVLQSGTYIPLASLSVWPSWKDKLSNDLGADLPVDPINRLSSCPTAYNPRTCWDENDKSYYPGIPAYPGIPRLASTSFAYTYNAASNGSGGQVCAVIESGLSVRGNSICELDICIDNDGDGYGLNDSGLCKFSGSDCNDANPSVLAGAPELAGTNCDDGIDNDCDGMADCSDAACALDPNCVAAALACNFNGICEPGLGEDCLNCAADGCCGLTCPDSICDEACECPFGPSPCPADCPCGNGGPPECGEECDDGNLINGDGCDDTCHLECTDNDGDRHIAENNAGFAACDNCGLSNDQVCVGYNDCNDNDASIFYDVVGTEKDCSDAVDDNCNSGPFDGCEPDDYPLACEDLLGAGHYSALRAGDLRCCGDDPGQGNPYNIIDDPFLGLCDGSSDNDCDGDDDFSDSDCTGICTNTEDDMFDAGACVNQCSNLGGTAGDDDGDQTAGEDWSTFPADAPDECDDDCGIVADTVHSGQYEINETLCDDIDNDCDGTIDESHPNKGNVCTVGVGICEASGIWVCDGTGGIECSAVPGPADLSETCGNGLDDDCNGLVDDGCAMIDYCPDNDGDGFGTTTGMVTAAVHPGAPSVLDCTDCDDSASGGGINPGMIGLDDCDGVDNDCDGTIDEDAAPTASVLPGVCNGVDNVCMGALGWVEGYLGFANYTPLIPESGAGMAFCDGDDNNCDGTEDEGFDFEDCEEKCESVANQAWVDPLSTGTFFCCGNDVSESPYQATEYLAANDLCDDGHDNDCDGLDDCDDDDCLGISPFCPRPCTFDALAPHEFEMPCVFP